PGGLGILGRLVVAGLVRRSRGGGSRRGAARPSLDLLMELEEGELATGDLVCQPLALPRIVDLHELIGGRQRVFAQGHELANFGWGGREPQPVLEVALVLAE